MEKVFEYGKKDSIFSSIEFLTLFLGIPTFVLLKRLTPLRKEVDNIVVWILYFLVMLDLVLGWKIVKSLLLPQTCDLVCPLRIMIRFNIYLLVYLSLWIIPLPPLTLKGLTFIGVSNIILGILVMLFNHDSLKETCDDLRKSNGSYTRCGMLNDIRYNYYRGMMVIFIIHGIYSIVQATKDSTFQRMRWILIFIWVTNLTAEIISSLNLVNTSFDLDKDVYNYLQA